MTSASSNNPAEVGPVRVFTGDTEDFREYRRWKTWCLNKMLTMDKLSEAARGAYIMTLLAGKAYETVEHLDPADYQKKDGDKLIWQLLDARFPKLDAVDELSEILSEVFSLKAREGETMKQWSARATELFDRCNRKAGVSFPDEAKGWILLNRAMLNDEQRAVVVSRARGDLKRESIASALRSCYPDLVIKRKGAASVEETLAVQPSDPQDLAEELDFEDVEEFLTDHTGRDLPQGEDEGYPEQEVAEVLAASWREKRQELNKLQRTRQFQKAKDVRRSFRVEIEELKKQTTCNKCGKRGHWARECRSGNKGSGKGSAPSGSTSTSGVAMVESELDFVAMASERPSMLERLQLKRVQEATACPPFEIMLISSPGFGVLDSGCGRTIIGKATLLEFERLWKQQGVVIPQPVSEVHQFRFGNGHVETSTESVCIPVWLAGKRGSIRAAIVSGSAPLLISRTALKALQASIDFHNDELRVFNEVVIPLKTNAAGQYVIQLMQDSSPSQVKAPLFEEVMLTELPPLPALHASDPRKPPCNSPSEDQEPTESEDASAANADHRSSASYSKPFVEGPSTDAAAMRCWVQEDSGVSKIPWVSSCGPSWHTIHKRVVLDAVTKRVLASHEFQDRQSQRMSIVPLPPHSGHVITKFFHTDPRVASETIPGEGDCVWVPSAHQFRQLNKQIEVCHETLVSQTEPVIVQEVFSPPRFALEVKAHGLKAFSYDLKNGFDLSTRSDRSRVEEALEKHPPELLVLCPPCTDEGGWFFLNSSKWDRLQYLKRVAQSRSFIKWCCKLFHQQVNRGKRALFEHPTGAKTWSYPEVQSLCRKHYTVKLHMCRYGMQLPGSERFIRKSTRLLVSHEDMQVLSKLCEGVGKHEAHDVVAGRWPGVSSVSQYAGQYPRPFVKAVLHTVPAFRDRTSQNEVLEVIEDDLSASAWNEVNAVARVSVRTDEELKPVLMKLHKNLGHPPNHDLVRVLKHGQASEQALKLAKDLSCDFCKSQSRPSVPLPAQSRRITEVNHQVGLDVKLLQGWRVNQKIKALNLVDYASGFQRMIPFFEPETSSVIRQLYQDNF